MTSNLHIFCPECKSHLPEELASLLIGGKDVFCEICGFAYSGIAENGEVKPLADKYKQDSDSISPDLNQKENQWITWKAAWSEFKGNAKKTWGEIKETNKKNKQKYPKKTPNNTATQFSSNQYTSSSNVHIPNPNQYTPSSNQYTSSSNAHIPNPNQYTPSSNRNNSNPDQHTPSPNQYNQYGVRLPQSSRIRITNTIRWFERNSSLFLIITALISIGEFVGNITNGPALLQGLGKFLFIAFLFSLDTKYFLPKSRDDYLFHSPRNSLSLIFFGFMSLWVNGAGIFIFIRGILSLNIFIDSAKLSCLSNQGLQTKDGLLDVELLDSLVTQNKAKDDLKSLVWTREIIYAIYPYMVNFMISYYVMALLISIGSVLSAGVGYMVPSIVFSSVGLGLFLGVFYPTFDRSITDLRHLEEGKIVLILIIGLAASSNGWGFPILVLSILLFVVQDKYKKASPNMIPNTIIPVPNIIPKRFEIQRDPVGVIDSRNQLKNTFMIVCDGPQKPYAEHLDKYGEPTPIFDPRTGQMRVSLNIPSESYNEELTEQTIKDSPSPNLETPPIVERIYTVLDKDVRDKLLSLEISDENRNAAAKNLIYLDRNEQIKFLLEIQQAQGDGAKENLEYNGLLDRINSLTLKKGQHEKLISQMGYMPRDEQIEFVQFLEETIN